MQNLFQCSGNLRAPAYGFKPTESGSLTLPYQQTQLVRAGLTDQLEGVLESKLGHDVDITGVLLIQQCMNTVKHHIEFRPIIPISFSDPPIEIEHFPTNPDSQG
jgi:hypothetical protein